MRDNFVKTLMFLVRKLQKVPELDKTIGLLNKNSGINCDFAQNPIEYTLIIFLDYLFLFKCLMTLSDDDINLIRRINMKRKMIGLDTNPLGHRGIDVLYSVLTKSERNILWTTFIDSLNYKNKLFKIAVDDLSKRMMLASKLSSEGKTLKDGDPLADKVIWGHTRSLTPEATIHFVICHFMDRLTFQILSKSMIGKVRKMLNNKHYLFDPLGDIVFLQTSKKVINPEISKRWLLKREDGGLSWNSREEQIVFDEEYNKQNS